MGRLLLTDVQTAVTLGWRPGFATVAAEDGAITIVTDGRRSARVGSASPARAALLARLGEAQGAPLARLVESDERMAEIEARSLLNRLAARGLLSARLVDAEGVAATIATPVLPDDPLPPADALTLAADVLVRRAAGGLVLESAADPARSDPIEPRFAAALLTGELPEAWRATLRHARVLTAAEPVDPRWEFHDRLFHTRSRLWHGPVRPYGRTLRLAGEIEPLPAEHVPAGATGAPIRLPTPPAPAPPPSAAEAPPTAAAQASLASAGACPPYATYAQVADARRSRRQPSAPLTAHQLGELLHLTLRVRGVRPAPAGDELDRPLPSGGALGAVGVYPLVVECEGIEPGLYHYDGRAHALRAIEAAGPVELEPLVAGARETAGLPAEAPVQVLLLLAARFGRLQYKYSGMAYAAALKDVGVAYQALYLAATAIGIGGCALGGGDALAFERASGLDRWEEGSVGEFLLVGGGG